ncbi:MAG: type II secretion system protein [Armatimonadia bacterium]
MVVNTKGYSHIGGRRSGFTLIELLAAMVVLLIGVYSVAALFPRLSKSVSDEERRTTITRAVAELSSRYQSDAAEAPEATAPADADINALDPNSLPQDPDSTSLTTNPVNSRDDIVQVYGEEFRVPAPSVAGGFPCYVPKGGLIDPNTLPTVIELRSLTEAAVDPGPGGTVASGEFYLRPDGMLIANSGTGYVSVDYDWTANNLVRHAVDEMVPVQAGGTLVQAQQPVGPSGRGGAVVLGNTQAYAVYGYTGSVGDPNGTTLPTGSLSFVVDSRAGQAIYFPPDAVGKRLKISYRLRREDIQGGTNQRLALIMHEDKTIPATAPYELPLGIEFLDDANELFTQTFDGTQLTKPEWVMMVDLTDGTPIGWEGQTSNASFDFLRGISNVDFRKGLLTIDSTALASRLGHPVRIYYRTLEQHSIQVQRAPAEFVEVTAGFTPNVPFWQHRQFCLGTQVTGGHTYGYVYGMPAYCEDQAVQVDYMIRKPGWGTPRRVSNEVHVVTDLRNMGAGYGFGFALNEPDIVGITRVRGVSVRVVGWWRTEAGRQGRMDLTNMLFPDV